MDYLAATQMELLIFFASHGLGVSFRLVNVTAENERSLTPGCILPARRSKQAPADPDIAVLLANLALFLADLLAHFRAILARIGRLCLSRGCGTRHKDCNAGQGQRESGVLPFAFHIVLTEQLTYPAATGGKKSSCVPIASTRPSVKGPLISILDSIADLDVETVLAGGLLQL